MSVVLHKKYECLQMVAEDVFSYLYTAQTVVQKTPLYIWKYKSNFLNDTVILSLKENAETWKELHHSNILPCVDSFYEEGSFYTVHPRFTALMPLELFLKQKQHSASELWKISSQILSVLLYLESKKVICGAINLSHIFIGPQLEVCVGSILVSVTLIKEQFDECEVVDDGVFYAPEFIVKHQFDHRSDIYAFGVLLYVLFSHSWPYSYSNKVEELKKSFLKHAAPFKKAFSKIPHRLDLVIARSIEKVPEARFQSFQELVDFYNSEKSDTRYWPVARAYEDSLNNELKESVKDFKKKQFWKRFKWGLLIGFFVFCIVFGNISFLKYMHVSGSTVVPAVVGLSLEEAEKILNDTQLMVVVAGEKVHPSIPKGYVVDSKPKSGSEIKENREVRLYISKGPGDYLVPLFVGKTLDRVKQMLPDDVTLNVREYVFSDVVPEGEIIAQSPSQNNVLEKNKPIQLIVSKGKALP